MGTHWVVGYKEAMVYYDDSLHMRMLILRDAQILVGIFPTLTTNLDELDEMHYQRLE
jgi:hypothetical protein